MDMQFVIDCGSRSIKLHEAVSGAVTLCATRSWDPINDARHAPRLGELLVDLTRDVPANAAIHVVGTAAARRNPDLASAIRQTCEALGWTYETLSQEREAALIRTAFGSLSDCIIVNAGGGSIQIVMPGSGMTLLPFGISDLNRDFGLNLRTADRRIAEATAFVRERLPAFEHPFIYSGGELSYLRSVGAAVEADGRCADVEFERVTERVDRLEGDELASISPFDPGWSSGAVASNAIVRACLTQSGAGFYYASDINIADGVLSSLLKRT